ncbi:MAG: hypothetical protein QXE96_05835 [Candidatus Caldarchaeum sp.]|jgi:glycerol uptake facilitator-like aquaporin
MFSIIVRLDIIFEVISFFISIAISAVALAAGRRTGSRSLTLLAIGFLLMAIAMFIRVALTSWALNFPTSTPPRLRILPTLVLQIQELVYSVVRISGYVVFLILYSSYSSSGKQPQAMLAISPAIIYNPLFEAISAILLAFVVYQLVKSREHGGSPYVLIGFLLLLLSHILFLLLPLSIGIYFLAQFTQLLSLLLFLTAVLSVLLDGQRL